MLKLLEAVICLSPMFPSSIPNGESHCPIPERKFNKGAFHTHELNNFCASYDVAVVIFIVIIIAIVITVTTAMIIVNSVCYSMVIN